MMENKNFLGNLISGDGLNAKITVDIPDKVYINLFFTVFLASAASATSIIILRKILTKN